MKIINYICIMLASSWLAACQFKFIVPPQKSALEKQLIGNYETDPDEYLLLLTHRGSESKISKRSKFNLAVKNRKYNQDDIDLLLSKEVLAESSQGFIVMNPRFKLKSAPADIKKLLTLAQVLIKEENQNRKDIWDYQISSREGLNETDLPKISENFYKERIDYIPEGSWYQTKQGNWQQKTETNKK